MKKTTILFDLDGTLLPMDLDEFIRLYFEGLRRYFEGVYDFETLSAAIRAGTGAMAKNRGAETNEDAFWRAAGEKAGIVKEKAESEFLRYYETDFEIARGATGAREEIRRCVHRLKERGCTLVVATNPMFPKVATRNRLRWAGFDPDDFSLITTYEDTHFCKPSVGYYREILEKLGKAPEECIMVGNDNQEDMCAQQLGIDGYLITDCLINRADAPIECTWHGTFEEFARKMEEMF